MRSAGRAEESLEGADRTGVAGRVLPDAVDYEVLTSEPDRLLRYRWRGSEFDSVVTFELTASPTGGTHLRVDHRVLADVLPFRSRSTEPVACAGSPLMMLHRAA